MKKTATILLFLASGGGWALPDEQAPEGNTRTAWYEGVEDIAPKTPSGNGGFRGRTLMTSGMGFSSSPGQASAFSAGLAHELSPRLTLFTQTSTFSGAGISGLSEFGFHYQGFSVGDWSLGFSGSFAPSASLLGQNSSADGARAWLADQPGYRFSTTLGRDWGDVSTFFRLSFNQMPAAATLMERDPWAPLSLFP